MTTLSYCLYAHTEQSRTASWVDILSGTLRLSHAPALLSGIFIPILQSTNRLWLAAAGAAGLHTRIRAGHHENCAANRNRTSCIQLHPGGSRVRVRHSQDIKVERYASVLSKAIRDKAIQRWLLWLPLWGRGAVCGLTLRRWWDQSRSDLLETADLQYIGYLVTIYSRAALPMLHLSNFKGKQMDLAPFLMEFKWR